MTKEEYDELIRKIKNGEISDLDISEVHEPEPEADISALVGKVIYGVMGTHTIDEYIALPEGTRVELIDGRFYSMSAPTTIHQSIAVEICRLLKNFVEKKGEKCVPFIAPTDVQLDCDDKTMVQPDVLVVCDRSKITRARIVGAPDFVVEIVSPSNSVTDIFVKKDKYQNAGVREYWMVHPENKAVTVYEFEKGPEPKLYTFEDTVPVGIWNGECGIDFGYIYSQIEFMYVEE